MLRLASDDVEITLDPWKGGGMTAFQWRGIDVFRPHTGGDHPIDLACFPLVPFCNRIADGRVSRAGEVRTILMSQKGVDPQHAIHGLGWISPWAVKQSAQELATLTLAHDGSIWPWSFSSEQQFRLRNNGYSHMLTLTNTDEVPMPAGLGLHPYFPRDRVKLENEFDGYWQTGPDRLPTRHCPVGQQPDWFSGTGFDNCFTSSGGPIRLSWPRRTLTITPSSDLPFTHVYTPPGEDYFCVEPVSHIPDAVNSPLGRKETGLRMLEPGETFSIECSFTLEETA